MAETWGSRTDLQAAKADDWFAQATQSTEDFLRGLGWQGNQSQSAAPALDIALPTAEAFHAAAPWRDLDPAPATSDATDPQVIPQRSASDPSVTQAVSSRPAAASGAAAAMPSGAPAGPPSQAGGQIDNSSRESFVRTAYPLALQAAGGDPELAKRMLAMAISENGTVGSGGAIGVGNNFGGIKYDPQASGSGNYGTWESEGGARVNQNADFAAYANPQDGFNAIPRFIQTNMPQAWARYQQTHDAAGLIRDINAAGYATNPTWHQDIESIRAGSIEPAVVIPPQATAQPQPDWLRAALGAGQGAPTNLKQPTMGPDTATGDQQPYDPRDADQGSHEAPPTPTDVSPTFHRRSADGLPTPSDPTVSDPNYTGPPPGAPSSQIVQDTGVNDYPASDYQQVPTTPTPAPQPPAQSPPGFPGLQAVYDASGRFLHWIQNAAQGAVDQVGANMDQNRRNVEQANAATGYGQVTSTPGEPDYVPQRDDPLTSAGRAVDQALRPAGGAPEMGARLREINDRAARDQGKSPTDVRAMFQAADDPAWRARNPEIAAEYDDLSQQYGLTVMGQAGDTPKPGNAPQTVEALQQRLAQARNIVDRLLGSGDARRLAAAQDARAALESQLIDAQNARRALEPAIRSDVGTPIQEAAPAESSVERATDAQFPRESGPMAPEDLSGPVSIPTDTGSRLNSGVGPVAGRGIAPALSNAAQGAVLGAAAEQMQADQEGRPVDRGAQARNALIGGGLAVLAGRAIRPGEGRTRLGSGVVPEGEPAPRYDPRLAQEPVLPGMEPPRATGDAGPPVSETPSGPRSLADVMANRGIRQGGLPGVEPPPSPIDAGLRRPISDEPNRPPNLGDIPRSAIQEPTLPGMQPPNRPYEQVGPLAQSDAPSGPRSLADVMANRGVRQGALPGVTPPGPRVVPLLKEPSGALPLPSGRSPGLPGFEHIDPLTDPTPFIPPNERSLLPSNSLQTTPQIVENVIRQEQAQAQRLARASASNPQAGQTGLPTVPQSTTLAQRIRAATEPWERRLNITRYAGMLSDTATHIFNLTSNAVLQGVDVAATPIAAALDAGRSAITSKPRQVFFSEAPARIAGMRAGLKVGLQNAAEILRTGLTPVDAAKQLEGGASGMATGSAAVDFAFEAPLRALAASDAVFRTAAQGGHLAAEGMAAAMKANPGVRITPDLLRAAMKDPALLDRAQKLAARSVLQEDRQVTTAYQKFVQALGPEGRLLVSTELPFVKTPYNVVAQGVGLTPAGLLGVVQDMAEHKPAREIEYRVARVALGTAVMGVAAADYASGSLTGPRPTDPKELSTLPPGWQPWSQKIPLPGGGTYYLPLSLLGPLALPPVAAILMGESAKKGGDMTARAGRVALGVGQYASQNTFFQSLSNIGGLLDQRDAEHNIERNVQQVVSQFSPHIIGGGALGREIQRVMGMPMRDPQGALEALLATHPLTAGRVEPRQDVLGRPSIPYASGPVAAIARVGKENDAGVIRAFRSAREGLPMAAPKQIRDPSQDAMTTLTPRQQHQWRRVFGQALSEDWNNNGNPQDADALRRISGKARDVADQTVLGLR